MVPEPVARKQNAKVWLDAQDWFCHAVRTRRKTSQVRMIAPFTKAWRLPSMAAQKLRLLAGRQTDDGHRLSPMADRWTVVTQSSYLLVRATLPASRCDRSNHRLIAARHDARSGHAARDHDRLFYAGPVSVATYSNQQL